MATRIPFTELQWEELENQALIFKYLAANVPVPPHLLFLIRRPYLFSSSSSSSSSSPSNFLSPHFGWNVYEMGLGRKIDTEPGRCRRTDGKKWRCSKEASPESKYCERHMHRGKNRSSRKPLALALDPPQFSTQSPLSSSSRVRRRSEYMEMEDDDGSCGNESLKQREKLHDRHCFILGTDLEERERPLMLNEKLNQREDRDYDDVDEEEEQRSKRVYRFLDEWPSSSKSPVSTSLFI